MSCTSAWPNNYIPCDKTSEMFLLANPSRSSSSCATQTLLLKTITMQEMTAQSWKRRGCSIVWSPQLLAELIPHAIPLRTMLEWQRQGLPETPPVVGKTLVVGGLQTVLEVLSSEESYAWVWTHIRPLCRMWGGRWEHLGLVFGMDGPAKFFQHNEADDLVYFGKGGDLNSKLCLTRALWNGAATGTGAFKLMHEDSKEIGGFHVNHLS